MSNQSDLITKLITLTNQGMIRWEDKSNPFSTNHFETEHKGLRFFTEWLRDEKPCLGIGKADKNCEVLADYQIKHLIELARAQCETPEKIAEKLAKTEAARELLTQDAKRKDEFVAGVLESLKE